MDLATLLLAALVSAPPAPRDVLPTDPRPSAYHLELTIDPRQPTFGGRVTIDLESRTTTAALRLDAVDLTFARAELDGVRVAAIVPQPDHGRVRLQLARPLTPGKHALTIDYRGRFNEAAQGLFRNGTGAETRVLSQLEPGDARRVLPLWDEPAIKAVFHVALVTRTRDTALSNMPVARVEPSAPGRRTVVFEPTPPMSSYLLFVGVGEFTALESASGAPRLAVRAPAATVQHGAYALAATRDLLAYYADYFGSPYALPKLDLVAAPLGASFGAMENWGAILFDERWLLSDPARAALADRQYVYVTVAHELAHQWFGNLVTMGWWDDLWLNEGFASWMEVKSTDHFNPTWQWWLAGMADVDDTMSSDAGAATHAIVQPVRTVRDAEQAFDGITYLKGQAVVRMIEAYLGEAPFRDGVRAYLRDHAGGTAVTADLWRALEAASKVPITAIAADFTEQPGVPLVRVEDVRCTGGRSLVTLRQGRHATDEASRRPQRWRVPVVLGVLGQPAVRVLLDGEAEVSAPGCGPLTVNRGQTGYFRTRYADGPRAALEAAFDRLPVADQLGLLYDAQALGATGDLPFEAYVALAGRLPVGADPLVWTQVASGLMRLVRLHRGLPTEGDFAAFVQRILGPVLADVRATTAPGDTTIALHEALLEALAYVGDPAVIAEARALFAASARDPTVLRAERRAGVLATVGLHADLATWTAMRARARHAAGTAEKLELLTALAGARDPDLADRTLALAFSAEVPRLHAPDLVRVVARLHPQRAWRAYLAHRAAVDARLDVLNRYAFPAHLVGRSADPALGLALEAFAAQHIPATARQEVAQARAAIAIDVRLRTEQVLALDAWMAARGR